MGTINNCYNEQIIGIGCDILMIVSNGRLEVSLIWPAGIPHTCVSSPFQFNCRQQSTEALKVVDALVIWSVYGIKPVQSLFFTVFIANHFCTGFVVENTNEEAVM